MENGEGIGRVGRKRCLVAPECARYRRHRGAQLFASSIGPSGVGGGRGAEPRHRSNGRWIGFGRRPVVEAPGVVNATGTLQRPGILMDKARNPRRSRDRSSARGHCRLCIDRLERNSYRRALVARERIAVIDFIGDSVPRAGQDDRDAQHKRYESDYDHCRCPRA